MQTGAAYIRVSTEDQIEFSPDSQIKKIREYAANHNISLPEEFLFLDEGISGRNALKRPAFMKMIGVAKTKPRPFDVILVWKFSRFARNRQDSILYKSMLRKECGIDVISITEQLSDDPTAILIEALLEAMDEYYSINLAQEVKRGMNEKFSRGGVVSIPPFGYVMGEENFEVDKNKAAIVRMMYDDFLNGMGYRQIAAKLNDMGIRSNRGNPWEIRTVEYVLSNPVYLGKLRRNPNGADPMDRYHRGENVIVVNGAHPAIISEEQYAAVQEQIDHIRKNHLKYIQTSYTTFMLRGIVRCSNCGSTLIKSAKGTSLQCHKYTKGQCSVSHSITIRKLNAAVLAQLEKDQTNGILNIHISLPKNSTPTDTVQVLLEQEYKKLERIKTAYEAGIDSLEEYQINKINIQKRIQELNLQLNKPVMSHPGQIKTFQQKMKTIIPKLKSAAISESDKNRILQSFVAKIVFCRADESIQIYYRI